MFVCILSMHCSCRYSSVFVQPLTISHVNSFIHLSVFQTMPCASPSPRLAVPCVSLSPRLAVPCVSLSPRLTSRPRSSVRHIYGNLQQESLVRKRHPPHLTHPTPPGSVWTSSNLPLPLDLGALEPGAFSLPTLSRPPTARSRTSSSRVTTPRNVFINIDDDLDDDNWNCVRARSMSPDLRSETSSSVGSLARQCCDVLGPRVCQDCTKIRARSTRGHRDTPLTSRLHMPERNLAVALLVAKALPSLSVHQIQTELNENKIVRPCFKTALARRLQYEKERLERERTHAQHKTRAFSLTHKFAPEVKPPSKQDGVLKLAAKSFAELMYPTFVSPRKVKSKDSYFVAYYEPPVIPKACQNVEPAFFAGTDACYELPERLPDELFAED